jgi:HEXXH motif-containing protein
MTVTSATLAGALRPGAAGGDLHLYQRSVARKHAALVTAWLAGAERAASAGRAAQQLRAGWNSLDQAQREQTVLRWQLSRWLDDVLRVGLPGKVPEERIGPHLDRLAALLLVPVAQADPEAVVDWRVPIDPAGRMALTGSRYSLVTERTQGGWARISCRDGWLRVRQPDGGDWFAVPAEGFLHGEGGASPAQALQVRRGTAPVWLCPRSLVPGTLAEIRSPIDAAAAQAAAVSEADGEPALALAAGRAWTVLDCWPAGRQDVAWHTQVVQPFAEYADDHGFVFTNVVHEAVPCVSFISGRHLAPDTCPLTLAEELVHLAAHSKEALLLKVAPTTVGEERYPSPWRREDRPIRGIMAGTIAFMHVCELYARVQRHVRAGGEDPAGGRLDYGAITRQHLGGLSEGLSGLRRHASERQGLTEVGLQLLTVLERWWHDIKQRTEGD